MIIEIMIMTVAVYYALEFFVVLIGCAIIELVWLVTQQGGEWSVPVDRKVVEGPDFTFWLGDWASILFCWSLCLFMLQKCSNSRDSWHCPGGQMTARL